MMDSIERCHQLNRTPGVIGLEISNNSVDFHSNNLGLYQYKERQEYMQLLDVDFLSVKATA
jgi:hypothetical protein